jgi:hypothetical protein
METSSRSSALVGLCATGGAVAVLTSAGLVPAIGLAFGLGGGWLLGQKLKSKTQKPQAFAAHRSTCCGGGWWWVRMPQMRMDLLKMMLFTFPFIHHLRDPAFKGNHSSLIGLQVAAQPQPVEVEDETDEEQEEAIQELGEFMGAEVGEDLWLL